LRFFFFSPQALPVPPLQPFPALIWMKRVPSSTSSPFASGPQKQRSSPRPLRCILSCMIIGRPFTFPIMMRWVFFAFPALTGCPMVAAPCFFFPPILVEQNCWACLTSPCHLFSPPFFSFVKPSFPSYHPPFCTGLVPLCHTFILNKEE